MTFNYHRYGSLVGSDTSVGTQTQKGIHNLTSAKLTRPYFEGFAAFNKDAHTFTLNGGTYKIFLCGAGGGGAYTYADREGGNGALFSLVATLPAGQYECGVGEGGQYQYTDGSVNPPRNSAGYAMLGGQGSSGDNQGSGSGGGGTYLKANFTLPATVPNWNNYIAIAGGGGGCATHDFNANFGGHGFGVAGGTWSANWPNTNNTYSGDNGFDGSGGGGGVYQSGGDTDQNGGSASVADQLTGGNAYSNVGCQNGGGGGGGAGGGSAGGGGGSARTTANRSDNGGYISTTTTTNGFTTEIIPRGGGGGGGHANDCGAAGAGAGSLIFSDYTNSWTGSSEGSGYPWWGSTRGNSGSSQSPIGLMQDYNAFSEMNTYYDNSGSGYCTGGFSAYFFDMTSSATTYYGRGWGGVQGTAGGRGFFLLTSHETYFNWATDMTSF